MRPGEQWNDEMKSNLCRHVTGGILNMSLICTIAPDAASIADYGRHKQWVHDDDDCLYMSVIHLEAV